MFTTPAQARANLAGQEARVQDAELTVAHRAQRVESLRHMLQLAERSHAIAVENLEAQQSWLPDYQLSVEQADALAAMQAQGTSPRY